MTRREFAGVLAAAVTHAGTDDVTHTTGTAAGGRECDIYPLTKRDPETIDIVAIDWFDMLPGHAYIAHWPGKGDRTPTTTKYGETMRNISSRGLPGREPTTAPALRPWTGEGIARWLFLCDALKYYGNNCWGGSGMRGRHGFAASDRLEMWAVDGAPYWSGPVPTKTISISKSWVYDPSRHVWELEYESLCRARFAARQLETREETKGRVRMS